MLVVLLLSSIAATYNMIDPVTGLPDLSSDVYQIPLNTDSLPYKDLQAEARLPRQPLLPDDIIPTVALLTGLDSDNTGQVVHTDDNHAAKVYVVNQPASGGGGASPVTPNKWAGNFVNFSSPGNDSLANGPNPLVAGSRLCQFEGAVSINPDDGPYPRQYLFVQWYLHGNTSGHNHYFGTSALTLFAPDAGGSHSADVMRVKWDYGLSFEDIGFQVGERIELWFIQDMPPTRMATLLQWYEP